jgi:hypothetical protein
MYYGCIMVVLRRYFSKMGWKWVVNRKQAGCKELVVGSLK